MNIKIISGLLTIHIFFVEINNFGILFIYSIHITPCLELIGFVSLWKIIVIDLYILKNLLSFMT